MGSKQTTVLQPGEWLSLLTIKTQNVTKWDRQTDRPGSLEWLFKNCDGTGTDKGSQDTKQILAELTEPGGRTMHYEILELINSI